MLHCGSFTDSKHVRWSAPKRDLCMMQAKPVRGTYAQTDKLYMLHGYLMWREIPGAIRACVRSSLHFSKACSRAFCVHATWVGLETPLPAGTPACLHMQGTNLNSGVMTRHETRADDDDNDDNQDDMAAGAQSH